MIGIHAVDICCADVENPLVDKDKCRQNAQQF
jgi:hypothetical protein